MNALATRLRHLINAQGSISLETFMAMALTDPDNGYYMTRDPIGLGGDFITSPEISQMFGELMGVWAIEVWTSLGRPNPFRLVELGPGRGTLMADLLRVAAKIPEFLEALDVHMVELSPVLREQQQLTLERAPCAIRWHEDLRHLPSGPVLYLANEFFDALPVRHYVRLAQGWAERLVGLNEMDQLAFTLSPYEDPLLTLYAPYGSILEISRVGQMMMRQVAEHVVRDGGAALILDYGYTHATFGETLQAMRGHKYVDPLDAPGEADLTAHVNFVDLAGVAREAHATTFGPIAQGEFLSRMGIELRADVLKKNATLEQTNDIDLALLRLTTADPLSPGDLKFGTGMGNLFKVLAICSQGSWIPPGFEEGERDL